MAPGPWIVLSTSATALLALALTGRWVISLAIAVIQAAGMIGLSRAAEREVSSAGGIAGRVERKGAVIWFTGLSGSGKSTVASWVCEELTQQGVLVEYLDGDALRSVFPATGFTREERDQHVRRTGYLASRLEAHGVTVVASLVSPYEASRAFVRNLCRTFVEVYVATPLEECERRDVKGLYARARRGEIRQFTGLDDPYEPPANPEISFDTSHMSVEEAGRRVLGYLRRAS